jgi:hypothetical protein
MAKNCEDSLDFSKSEEIQPIIKQLEDFSGKKDFNDDDSGQVMKQQDDIVTHRNPKGTDNKESKDGNLPKVNRRSGQVIQDSQKLGSISCKEEDMEKEWIFLDIVPDVMKCKICSGVLESPQLLSCCGTNICKKCMNRHLQRLAMLANQRPSCPFCRSSYRI